MEENLQFLIDTFVRRYDPAESIQDSTEQLSSDEILMLFGASETLSAEMINVALKNAGFILELFDLKFVWLVKEKAG